MAAVQSSPFSKVVVEAMRELFPEKLADKSFDNTGLLLEAPYRSHLKNTALLTIDLTTAVADEAIVRGDSIIIAYHPIIFRPLKALTLANSQQSTLMRLAQEGVSVYCPHTAVDAVGSGMNDWLADMITMRNHRSLGDSPYPWLVHERKAITPIADVPGFEDAGYGRIVTLKEPQPLGALVDTIIEGLGDFNGLKGVAVAVPQSIPKGSRSDLRISTIGICAGSGSMLNGLDVDMLFTGELSHHEALAAIERGKVVVTTFHSNIERSYLKRLKPLLDEAVTGMIRKLSNEDIKEGNDLPVWTNFEAFISKADRDPFEIVVAGEETW